MVLVVSDLGGAGAPGSCTASTQLLWDNPLSTVRGACHSLWRTLESRGLGSNMWTRNLLSFFFFTLKYSLSVLVLFVPLKTESCYEAQAGLDRRPSCLGLLGITYLTRSLLTQSQQRFLGPVTMAFFSWTHGRITGKIVCPVIFKG